MADIVTDVTSSNYLFPISSGAIKFKVKANIFMFWLVSKSKPYKRLYQVQKENVISITNLSNGNKSQFLINSTDPNYIGGITYEDYWVSWYNGCVCVYSSNIIEPVRYVAEDLNYHNQIGFINFHVKSTRQPQVHWKIEAPPFNIIPSVAKDFEGGEVRWQTIINNTLPTDAMIGGFENEPNYIARAYHNGSLCPGRYLPSKGVALIPWGFYAHKKYSQIEILCGYNVKWVQTTGNNIPDNAFIAGYSEVSEEPLYIGRAMYEGNLLSGKVHPLYKSCYLPIKGREVEVSSYDILVLPYKMSRGLL